MKQKAFKIISTVTFWVGIALSAFSVYTFISSYAGAPAGTCLISDGRPFMIAAVVFLVASFITSFFTGKKNKEAGPEEERKDD